LGVTQLDDGSVIVAGTTFDPRTTQATGLFACRVDENGDMDWYETYEAGDTVGPPFSCHVVPTESGLRVAVRTFSGGIYAFDTDLQGVEIEGSSRLITDLDATNFAVLEDLTYAYAGNRFDVEASAFVVFAGQVRNSGRGFYEYSVWSRGEFEGACRDDRRRLCHCG